MAAPARALEQPGGKVSLQLRDVRMYELADDGRLASIAHAAIAEHLDGKLNASTAKTVSAAAAVKADAIDVVVLAADPSVTASVQAVPKLSLIRQEGKERLAVLDGQQRRVGAMHGQYKVLSIGAGTVILAQGQRQLTLQLFPPMKK